MIFSTVSQMFSQVTNEYLNRELYFYKKSGDWKGISGREIQSTVKDIAYGLQSLGIGKGSNVALVSNNSPRWAMSDYGIICSGAATVSVYPTLIVSQVEYILNNSAPNKPASSPPVPALNSIITFFSRLGSLGRRASLRFSSTLSL